MTLSKTGICDFGWKARDVFLAMNLFRYDEICSSEEFS